ncbi:MAG: transglycosylase SLT domain-containing protein [Spirochaetes bacterium]|nr:transglycosylase SLT domain-containing protein [Spirochaetota bacterium]
MVLLKVKVVLLAVVFFLSSMFFIDADKNPDRTQSCLPGIQYYAEANYKKALLYLRGCTRDPGFIDYLKCRSYYEINNFSSVTLFNHSAVHDPFLDNMKRIYIARAYLELGDPTNAIQTADSISSKNIYINIFKNKILGDAYFRNEEFKNAAVHYSAVLQKTGYWKSHQIRLPFMEKNVSEKLFLNLFRCYSILEDRNNSLNTFYRYFDHVRTQRSRKSVLLKIHNMINTNFSDISHRILFQFAQSLFYFGKKDISEKYFSFIAGRDEKDTFKLKAYYFLALVHKNDDMLFIKYTDEILRIFERSDTALFYYARAHYHAGRIDEAKKYYDQLINSSNDPNIIKKCYYDLVSYYRSHKEYEEYVSKFYEMFKTDITASKLFFNTALRKLNNGYIDDAIRMLSILKGNRFFYCQSLYFLGKIHYEQGRFEEAYNLFFDLISKDPTDYYLVNTLDYFRILKNDKIITTLIKRAETFSSDELKYDMLRYLILGKNKYKENVFKLIGKKRNIKHLVFGKDVISLKRDRLLKRYLFFRRNGLYDEAHLIYKELYRKYDKKLDLYYSLLAYSVKNDLLSDSLKFRMNILYKLKLMPYLICFDDEYLRYYYPDHFRNIIEKPANKKKYSVEPMLLYSLIRAESLFDKRALSPAKAYGLFQIIEPTAKVVIKNARIKTDDTLYNVKINIRLGMILLHSLLKRYDNNPVFALSAYNAGRGRIKKWRENTTFNEKYPEAFIELIPFQETRDYIKKILAFQYFYLKLK